MSRRRRVHFKFLPLLLIAATAVQAAAQNQFPDKIRGYKVFKGDISGPRVEGEEAETSPVAVRMGGPVLSSVSLDGIVFEVDGTVVVEGRKGKIDFLAFHGFTVNGLPVEIRDHFHSYEFRDGDTIDLLEPIEIVVGYRSAVRAAVNELRESEEEWEVSGTVFVFGRFKWSLFTFKRVVPVNVRFKVPNPLKGRIDQSDPEESSQAISAAAAELFISRAMLAFSVLPPLNSLSLESRKGVTSFPDMPF